MSPLQCSNSFVPKNQEHPSLLGVGSVSEERTRWVQASAKLLHKTGEPRELRNQRMKAVNEVRMYDHSEVKLQAKVIDNWWILQDPEHCVVLRANWGNPLNELTKGSGGDSKSKDILQKEECLICRQKHAADPRSHRKTFSKTTSTGVLRKHLYEHHLDQRKLSHLSTTTTHARNTTTSTSDPKLQEKRTEFSQEAFVDTIIEFIVGDDQSINVVENKQLRAIFLMLRSELRDQDIPHRTTIRKRIIEVWDEHDTLECDLEDILGGNLQNPSHDGHVDRHAARDENTPVTAWLHRCP
ncbi:hypothetical protein B0H17DRAFT_1175431 [Mycena rosella]|uniref:Uncharacterized protein n=1 Tax=Mycena rosella TaxID=1033263 RepID=A0AAD7GTA0_MYCRO|nr:hypothetical protein B0H17DRAFT_1175431 [Mycena rosella]